MPPREKKNVNNCDTWSSKDSSRPRHGPPNCCLAYAVQYDVAFFFLSFLFFLIWCSIHCLNNWKFYYSIPYYFLWFYFIACFWIFLTAINIKYIFLNFITHVDCGWKFFFLSIHNMYWIIILLGKIPYHFLVINAVGIYFNRLL